MDKDLLKASERIDRLHAQDIDIIQSAEVFAFSLDAVLLAHFANPIRNARAVTVDLCAGNGAVSLFLSTKVQGPIYAVEIQERLADMAQRSVVLNRLDDRMQVLNIDLNDCLTYIQPGSVANVTCNPPYFADLPASQKNPNEYLAIARHELKVTLEQTIKMAGRLLKSNGRAFFVHRPERLGEIFHYMEENKLQPKRVQLVHPKKEREANIVLIEALKDGKKGGIHFLPPLITYNEMNEYTAEVKRILYGEEK